jgi:ketosteroid isomerase-like protein
MRTCLSFVWLDVSFALPTYVQQKDLADGKAFDEAFNNHDARAVAAFYTRDAVLVTDDGPFLGRQDIQTNFRELLQGWHAKNHIGKVDGNAVHLIGTDGNELWATREWSETGQGKNGEPIPAKGHWRRSLFVRAMIGRSGWDVEHHPGHLATYQQEFCTTTGRNAVPDRQPWQPIAP